ncbi:MAG TPA: alcohol dehydrogenase catalytic domain-containing protein [Flexivirga sp.]|uniref:alcohol dehydrogenase catalytic domain-containing protein n=1 Tax=Flexivirga sp. TaxID=1962927 RepID=UPI002C122679|nr:alcohol dehydrogenase catalytic domain-containing protein [Flexivirga sp.]HWC20799.1 alcohol dehydrogenase catalytic domain-containing protein [Flexivirga sp.]
MRAVLKTSAGRGATYAPDAAEPKAGDQEVVVEIAAASLCGTDRECYEWSPAAQAFNLNIPTVLGHEGAGTVVDVGAGVTDLRPGDRVALESHLVCGQCFPCRTGSAHACERTRILGMHIDGVFAERVAVPRDICVPLPDAVSLETGALLESAGVAVHAIQRSGYEVAGRGVIVSGGGPVGLVVAHLSHLMGAAYVVVVEPNPFRRAQAEKLGLTVLEPGEALVETVRGLSGRRGGADVAFECSGAAAALPSLFDAVRTDGTIVTVGHPSRPLPIDIAAHINKKGITLRGIFGRRLWETWEQTMLLLGSGRLDLDWLITHRLPLSQVDEAIGLLTGDACKVLLVPGLG